MYIVMFPWCLLSYFWESAVEGPAVNLPQAQFKWGQLHNCKMFNKPKVQVLKLRYSDNRTTDICLVLKFFTHLKFLFLSEFTSE